MSLNFLAFPPRGIKAEQHEIHEIPCRRKGHSTHSTGSGLSAHSTGRSTRSRCTQDLQPIRRAQDFQRDQDIPPASLREALRAGLLDEEREGTKEAEMLENLRVPFREEFRVRTAETAALYNRTSGRRLGQSPLPITPESEIAGRPTGTWLQQIGRPRTSCKKHPKGVRQPVGRSARSSGGLACA
jgi:hypothetical protein